jgi:hypothetical protein
MARMKGIVTQWFGHFGFCTAADGKEFFLTVGCFRYPAQAHSIRVGKTVVEFELLPRHAQEKRFMNDLNQGFFRDDPSFDKQHRNPRLKTKSSYEKPKAVGILVLKEKQ